jgi:hypothetical protein
MGELGNPTFDHGAGLGDDDGALPQSRGPMLLLSVVALQGDGFAFALVMAADCQHQRIDGIAVGVAEQAHLPAVRRSNRRWKIRPSRSLHSQSTSPPVAWS